MNPLCGGTRATRSTVLGEWGLAGKYNPLGTVVALGLLVLRGVVGVLGADPTHLRVRPNALLRVSLAVAATALLAGCRSRCPVKPTSTPSTAPTEPRTQSDQKSSPRSQREPKVSLKAGREWRTPRTRIASPHAIVASHQLRNDLHVGSHGEDVHDGQVGLAQEGPGAEFDQPRCMHEGLVAG